MICEQKTCNSNKNVQSLPSNVQDQRGNVDMEKHTKDGENVEKSFSSECENKLNILKT